MLTRERKQEIIEKLTESVKRSQAFFIVDFKGLRVEAVTNLRKKLFGVQAEMKVSRNTLAKRALESLSLKSPLWENGFEGNNAFVFAYQDAAVVAKTLYEFSKENEALKLKSGFMDGSTLSEKQVVALASLPSKEVLRAQLLGVLLAPGSKLARTLNEVPASLARVLKAKADQGSGS